MRLGIFVNSLDLEEGKYLTTRLAMNATNRGHEVWYFGADDFEFDPDDRIRANAVKVSGKKFTSPQAYLTELRGKKRVASKITVDDIDVLLLRSDPSRERGNRSWAGSVGLEFGRIAKQRGVIVLNDPDGLSSAMNKMYFQEFPEELRPRTLITRDRDEIKRFVHKEKRAVLKPLQGSGGANVFLVTKANMKNLNQMIDAVSRDGYVIAQEYIPLAAEGDVRLFLMNGVPLKHKGKYAAFKRVTASDDIRSNLHVGGRIAQLTVDENMLKMAEMLRPKLVSDGMFLVGVDIAGDKILEINVFSPGGLGTAQKIEKVNFTRAVIEAIERKVEYTKFYKRKFNNTEIAML